MAKKYPLSLFALEIIFFVGFLWFLFFEVLKINIYTLSITPSIEGFDYFILLMLGLTPLIFMFLLKRNDPETYGMHKEVTDLYREKGKEKLVAAKNESKNFFLVWWKSIQYIISLITKPLKGEPKTELKSDIILARDNSKELALIIIQLMLFVSLAMVVFALLEPNQTLFASVKPFVLPFFGWTITQFEIKVVGSIAMMGVIFWLYNYTKPFRIKKKAVSQQ